ncbi:type 2 periplasmic-binding domain-containing protein [Streptomyces nondiastaticus]|uniref:Uncharacterized protein n=1 Tax=Streptomyces nondiastaticus TaxID=3154512 RepID=A0ABW6TZU1_9ACTN
MERYQQRTVVNRRFLRNDDTGGLDKGDIAPCFARVGDLVRLQADNSGIQYAMPDASPTFSSDNLLVPRNACHQRNAERLIDHYHQPKVAARLAAAVSYASP